MESSSSSPSSSSSSSSSSGRPPIEWYAWPGGQATALNPTESFESSDFGLEGNVDWDVGKGGVPAVIIETGGTTASNRSSITVRYDTMSPSTSYKHAAEIHATKGGKSDKKLRTVFRAKFDDLKFSGKLHDKNKLRFGTQHGTKTDYCGFNWPPEDNAERVVGKMQATLTTEPSRIYWIARNVTWTDSHSGKSGEFHIRLHRKIIATAVGQTVVDSLRTTTTNHQNWQYDGESDPGDAQNPTATGSTAFRIDPPGFLPKYSRQQAARSDFREICEWHNGTRWWIITPEQGATWHFNGTQILDPNNPGGPGIKGGENSHGAGIPAQNIPNSQPQTNPSANPATAQQGDTVRLATNPTDADNDYLTFEWTQTDGAPVNLIPDNTAEKPLFVAPAGPDTLKFSVTVKDITVELHHHKPDNGTSTAKEVTVIIEED